MSSPLAAERQEVSLPNDSAELTSGMGEGGNVKGIAWAIWGISAVITIAWFWESSTCGFCYISRHLAPIAIVGNLAAPFLIRASGKSQSSR